MVLKKDFRNIMFALGSILVIIFSCNQILFGQEKEAPKPSPIDVTGQVYMNWHVGLTDNSDKTGTKDSNTNTFELERIYLNFNKKFNDNFSAKVTLDIANDLMTESTTNSDGSEDTSTTTATTKSSKYRVFLKFGYLQAKNSFGFVNTTIKAGMIDTPVSSLTNELSDQRYLHKNLIDDSKNLIATSIDNPADMGLSIGLNFMKKADLTFAITNGEGYKKTNESYYNDKNDSSKNTSQGKAYYTKLTLMPIETLYISGFCRYEGTSVNESDDHKGYYGAGISWKNDLLKLGANYLLPFQKKNGEDVTYTSSAGGGKKKLSIMETWLTFTPKKLIQIPILAMARYGFGKDLDKGDSMTTYMGIGIGYELDPNIRVAAWFDQYDSEAKDAANNPNPTRMFSIRTDIRL
ncbi:MAG: hypothetical protein V1874_10755 [Spirochaetota bacterium]